MTTRCINLATCSTPSAGSAALWMGRQNHSNLPSGQLGFRRRDRRWRQVHHHGSFDDPEFLNAYQTAVHGGAKARLLGSWRLVRWQIENPMAHSPIRLATTPQDSSCILPTAGCPHN